MFTAQGNHAKALQHYQEALALYRSSGILAGEALALTNIGYAQYELQQLEAAETALAQSLTLDQRIGKRTAQSKTLVGLAQVKAQQNETDETLELLDQALSLSRELGQRPQEALTLQVMGEVLTAQDQSEVAIAFYKQAVNTYESLRGNIRDLDKDLQTSYTNSVAATYRALADLLIRQGRIPEAQKTLDLLKLEELREFTHTRATWNGSSLAYNELEQPIIDRHGDLIAFGQKLYNCEQINCSERKKLLQEHRQLIKAYQSEVKTFETTIRANRRDDDLFQDPDKLSSDARDLLEANPNAVLIYPFVTEEKLWLLYATPGNVGSISRDVNQADLSSTVQKLGAQLKTGSDLAELQATSQKLYDWIIDPLDEILQKNQIQHLIFVNDRVTRYIPMGILFDGQHYLLERYTLSSVLTPGLTDTEEKLGSKESTNVLGLGLSQPVEGFRPLPAVEEELDRIVRSNSQDPTGIYPGQLYLNDSFTLDQLYNSVADHRVLHIATHAAFVPGRPDESYLVLGNGDRLKIPEIDQMERLLDNLHLVVLSACQTGLGGEAGDGTEIAGLSAYFLRKRRAETVISSLWSVSDDSTSLLMQRFYELLASGELTKAQALQQAQLSLLYDEDTKTRLESVRAGVGPNSGGQRIASADIRLQHPYHWAAFTLIGNGL